MLPCLFLFETTQFYHSKIEPQLKFYIIGVLYMIPDPQNTENTMHD